MKALAGIKMSFELQRLVHKVCDFVVMAPSKGLLFRFCTLFLVFGYIVKHGQDTPFVNEFL